MRTYLLSAALLIAGNVQAQSGSPDSAPSSSPVSGVGSSLIENERQHRIQMDELRRQLELSTMKAKIAEVDAKARDASAPKLPTGAGGFPVIPAPGAGGSTAASAEPKKIAEPPPPPPPVPVLTAIVGNRAVFSVKEGIQYADVGADVSGYTVTRIHSNGVTLTHAKKTIEVALTRK